MASRINYDPPIRSAVRCEHCGQEIEATARITGSLEIRGLHHYEWRHVESGLMTCTKTFSAGPYDGWLATAAIEAAIAADNAVQRSIDKLKEQP